MSLERIAARAAIAFAMTFSLATLSANPAWADDRDPNKAALAFVKQQQVGSTLELMGYRIAVTTTTFAGLAKKLGPDRSLAVLRDELHRASPEYQDKWDANLATAYAKFFTTSELNSLAHDGTSSPAAPKLVQMQGTVGQEMQSLSMPLLQDYVSKALTAALSQNK